MEGNRKLLNLLLANPATDLATARELFGWYRDHGAMKRLILRAPIDAPIVTLVLESGTDHQRSVLAGRRDLPAAAYESLAATTCAEVLYALAENDVVSDEVTRTLLAGGARLTAMKVLGRATLSAELFQQAVLAGDALSAALNASQLEAFAANIEAGRCCGPWDRWPQHPVVLLAVSPSLIAHCPDEKMAELVATLAAAVPAAAGYLDAAQYRRLVRVVGNALVTHDQALVAAAAAMGDGSLLAEEVRHEMRRRIQTLAIWAANSEDAVGLCAALIHAGLADTAAAASLARSHRNALVPVLLQGYSRRWHHHSCCGAVVNADQLARATPAEQLLAAALVGSALPELGPSELTAAMRAAVVLAAELQRQLGDATTERRMTSWLPALIARAVRDDRLGAKELFCFPLAALADLPDAAHAELASLITARLGTGENPWTLFLSLSSNGDITVDDAITAAAAVLG